jgi:predicted aminopeptidase
MRIDASRVVWPRRVALFMAGVCLSSCSSLAPQADGSDFSSQLSYYAQALGGQFNLWSDAKAVDDSLKDPHLDPKLKAKLLKARQIRAFAVKELNLPDNGSYKNYLALNRPFVLWNVVATPELSLTPKQWCFPVAGCVSYRGYFDGDAAQAFAEQMRKQGNDVQVGGVPAYSTLGWFDDPLVSTFIFYSDVELAKLIFHELAHQVVYVAGDSQFNESFATAVEEAGVRRWLAAHGEAMMGDAYRQQEQRKSEFLALLLKHRGQLDALYKTSLGDAEKRARKALIFQSLRDDYQLLKQHWGGYSGYDNWFKAPLSNANLASIATYQDYVPAFQALMAREKTFPRFYAAVKALARQSPAARHRHLQKLLPPVAAH